MPMHKLKDGPITMTVAAIAEVEGNYGVQYKLTSEDGVDVYVNVAPFTRQMTRLSLDVETIIGKTVRLYQTQKDGTTFTNMDLAPAGASLGVQAGANTTPIRSSAPAAPAAPKLTAAEAGALYGECVAQAMGTFGVACEQNGIPVTAEALQSAAATLFIKLSR